MTDYVTLLQNLSSDRKMSTGTRSSELIDTTTEDGSNNGWDDDDIGGDDDGWGSLEDSKL